MTDIKKFYNVSEEIGKNYSLIQGAGGNTSFKDGDYIAIKKSGSNLSESSKSDIFSSKNLIDLKILNRHEKDWINNYHKKVFYNLKKFMNKIETLELKEACSAI